MIVWRTWKVEAKLLQPSRHVCAHCGTSYVELGVAEVSTSVQGAPYVSVFREGDARERLMEQLRASVEHRLPLRGRYRRCPSCRRGEQGAPATTDAAYKGAAIVGGLAGLLVGLLLTVALHAGALLFAGPIVGAVAAILWLRRRVPEVWPPTQRVPLALPEHEFVQWLRQVGSFEGLLRGWAMKEGALNAKWEREKGHVVLVLPPSDGWDGRDESARSRFRD